MTIPRPCRCSRSSRCCPIRTGDGTSSPTSAPRPGGFTRRPNVDLGLGALSFVGDLPADVPLFATARIAGFAAHLIEELQERPLRYRGLARTPV